MNQIERKTEEKKEAIIRKEKVLEKLNEIDLTQKEIKEDLQRGFITLYLQNEELSQQNKSLLEQLEKANQELDQIAQEREEKKRKKNLSEGSKITQARPNDG